MPSYFSTKFHPPFTANTPQIKPLHVLVPEYFILLMLSKVEVIPKCLPSAEATKITPIPPWHFSSSTVLAIAVGAPSKGSCCTKSVKDLKRAKGILKDVAIGNPLEMEIYS